MAWLQARRRDRCRVILSAITAMICIVTAYRGGIAEGVFRARESVLPVKEGLKEREDAGCH